MAGYYYYGHDGSQSSQDKLENPYYTMPVPPPNLEHYPSPYPYLARQTDGPPYYFNPYVYDRGYHRASGGPLETLGSFMSNAVSSPFDHHDHSSYRHRILDNMANRTESSLNKASIMGRFRLPENHFNIKEEKEEPKPQPLVEEPEPLDQNLWDFSRRDISGDVISSTPQQQREIFSPPVEDRTPLLSKIKFDYVEDEFLNDGRDNEIEEQEELRKELSEELRRNKILEKELSKMEQTFPKKKAKKIPKKRGRTRKKLDGDLISSKRKENPSH